MKILFAASEAAPYLKTGGLGDVAAALPKALSDTPDADVRVFVPYYKAIKDNPEFHIEYVTTTTTASGSPTSPRPCWSPCSTWTGIPT